MSIPFVMEMGWSQLRKKIELELRSGLSTGKSIQPRFETALTLAPQLESVSHSSTSFSFSNTNSNSPNFYASIPFEYCKIAAWTPPLMLAYGSQNFLVELASLPCLSNMIVESGKMPDLISHTNRPSFTTRSNNMKSSMTSSYLIKFPALTKNYQQINKRSRQPNTLITDHAILPEIKTKNHEKLTTITTITTPLHSHIQPCLPDPYEHIEIDIMESPTPATIEDDDHVFIFEGDPVKKSFQVYTMYKRVDKKIRPVSTNFPEDCHVR